MVLSERRRSGGRWTLTSVVLMLVLVGCEGGDRVAQPRGGDAPRTDPPAAATPAAGQTGDSQTVAVNQIGWNYGFEWEILDATLFDDVDRLLGQESRRLLVRVRLTNHGLAAAGGRGTLAAACTQTGRAVSGNLFRSLDELLSPDEVEVGETTEAVMIFGVDPCFDLDSGYLHIGKPTENHATLPIGPSAPPAVDLAPYIVDMGHEISMELFDLVLREARVTADRLHDHRALPLGERALYLLFDFAHRRPSASSLAPPSFELSLPGGGSEAPANWGPNYAHLAAHETHSLWLRFPLPSAEFAGAYSLTFTPGRLFQGSDEEDAHTFTFTLAP